MDCGKVTYTEDWGEIKSSSDEEKLREVIVRTILQEMLKEVPHAERKWYQKETWISGNEGRATNGKYLDKYKKLFPIFFYFSSKAKIRTLGRILMYLNATHMTTITKVGVKGPTWWPCFHILHEEFTILILSRLWESKYVCCNS